MNETDSRRIVTARALMWERASIEEQGKWLRMADDTLSELHESQSRPAQAPSVSESTP